LHELAEELPQATCIKFLLQDSWTHVRKQLVLRSQHERNPACNKSHFSDLHSSWLGTSLEICSFRVVHGKFGD